MLQEAVFVTMMRDPMDRWYSQYRFEHLEHRDASTDTTPFDKWYDEMQSYTMGRNYYTKTFIGRENAPDAEVIKPTGPAGVPMIHGDFYWTYKKYNSKWIKIMWEDFESALDILQRYHLVLMLEWINDSHRLIEEALGWSQPPRQVLPHELQAQRNNKKSKSAQSVLDAPTYQRVKEENALDYLLLDFSKRIFLERNSCGFYKR